MPSKLGRGDARTPILVQRGPRPSGIIDAQTEPLIAGGYHL
jgi:hypothetical protein